MQKTRKYTIAALLFCGVMTFATPTQAWAKTFSGPGLESGNYIVTVNAESVNVNKSHDNDEVLVQASQGTSYKVLEDMGDGWLKVQVGSQEGYIPLDGKTSVSELEEQAAEEAADDGQLIEAAAEASTARRNNLVNYALQFVGGAYRYGGTNPRTGVDCSGFTRYVMQNGAGVSLNHSSGAQATQGVQIGADQMRPGDLIFYGNGKRINHVAMYIGNGQIVHASTYKTGIKISNWNYRNPVKIMNVLGD